MCVCVSDADTITHVLQQYHERISSLEDVKFDLEYAVKKKDYEVELCYFLHSFSSVDKFRCCEFLYT
jgi:hypothetical protein